MFPALDLLYVIGTWSMAPMYFIAPMLVEVKCLTHFFRLPKGTREPAKRNNGQVKVWRNDNREPVTILLCMATGSIQVSSFRLSYVHVKARVDLRGTTNQEIESLL